MNEVHPTAIIENSTIWENVTVGPYSVIIDSAIQDDVTIDCHVDITNSTIWKWSEILSKARIIDNTIGENCSIGCEIKWSRIWAWSNAKHFGTVLRSVTSWENCNFGSGVKLANYDGKGKWTFELGENVFIGCNTVISTKADVTRKIGSNVKIWALCHVEQDVSDDSLVYVDRETGVLNVREGYYTTQK